MPPIRSRPTARRSRVRASRPRRRGWRGSRTGAPTTCTARSKAATPTISSTPEASGAYGSGNLDGRYDLSRDASLDAEGRFNYAREPLSALGLVAVGGAREPACAGPDLWRDGRRRAQIRRSDARAAWDLRPHRLSERGTGRRGDRGLASDDYNDWGLRGARQLSGQSRSLQPFVEFDVDARRYDGRLDAVGYERDSDGVTGLVGATLAYSQKLTGEASLGYGARDYQDPRLPRPARRCSTLRWPGRRRR